MKRVVVGVLVCTVILVFGAVCVAYAAIEDDAKGLAQKAALFIEENGKDKGITEVMNPKGRFSAQLKVGKLNLGVQDVNGVILANHIFPSMVGQDHSTLRDPNGKLFIKEAIEIAKTKGSGWIEFAFTNPDTKKIGSWRAWVQRVGGMDVFVLGLYWKQK